MKSPRLTNLTVALKTDSGSSAKAKPIISKFSCRAVLGLMMVLCALSPLAQAQVWTIKKNMSTFRDGFAAATGPDGKIYAIGGRNNAGNVIGSVDVYDPLKDTWTLNNSAGFTARAFLAAVTGRDGYIYTFGGMGGGTVAQRFDVATQQFTDLNPIPAGMARVTAAVTPDGKIYVMGASVYDPTKSIYNQQFDHEWVYNPANDTWQAFPYWSGGAEDGQLYTGLDGNVYLLPNWGDTRVFDGLGWNWVLPTWSNPSHLVRFAATTGSDGKLFTLGGNGDCTCPWPKASSLAAAVGPTDSMWNSIAPMNTRHAFFGASTAEGNVYAFGGWTTFSGNPHPLLNLTTEEYGPLPAPRFTSDGTVTGLNSIAAQFRFDQITGTSTPDNSGNYLTANLVNAPKDSEAGRVNKSIRFNIDASGKNKNTSQHVKVDDHQAISFGTGSFTFDAWIKHTWDWSGIVPVIDKRKSVTGGYRGYHVFIMTGGKLGLQLGAGGNWANYVTKNSVIPLAKNTTALDGWTHIAISIDRGSAPKARFYVNGVLTDEVSVLAGDIGDFTGTQSGPLLIGKHALGSMSYFGWLDEVTLYNRALNWAEIRAIFLAGRIGKQ